MQVTCPLGLLKSVDFWGVDRPGEPPGKEAGITGIHQSVCVYTNVGIFTSFRPFRRLQALPEQPAQECQR